MGAAGAGKSQRECARTADQFAVPNLSANHRLRSQPQPHVQAGPQDSLAQSAVAAATPIERLQSAVLQALTDGNQRILVSMLEAGEWTVEGNELVIKVSESQTVVDMSLGAEAGGWLSLRPAAFWDAPSS